MAIGQVKSSDLDSFFTQIGDKNVSANVLKATLSGEQSLKKDVTTFTKGWNPNSGNGNPGANNAVWGFAQLQNANLRSLAPKVLGGSWVSSDPNVQAQLDAKLHEAADDPKTSIKFMKAYLDNELPGIKKTLATSGVKYTQADLMAMVAGSYNLGGPRNLQVVKMSVKPDGTFDREAYYQNYYDNLNPGDQSVNNVNRLKRAAGDQIDASVSYKTKNPPLQVVVQSARDAELETDLTYLQSVGTGFAQAELPSLIIRDNLDNLPWYEDTELTTGNPNLRQIATPAWFEVNLKQSSGEKLAIGGQTTKVKLNVSLQELQESMAHVVNNKHSRTGFHITLWGQEPDSISASGTTGLFMNWFGITSLMSRDGKISESELLDAFLSDSRSSNSDYQTAADNENQPLRIAAQDAFIELLNLFKNNGITRFHPDIVSRIYPKNKSANGASVVGEASRTQEQAPMNPWSKAIGMSFTQATNRPNDVMTRGNVVFKYKNKQYLGYFKDIVFDMDSNNPFRWTFNFTFQVEKSLATTFYFKDNFNDSNFG